jgi:hypothetical protein
MDKIEIFLQGEGLKDVVIVQLPKKGSVRDLANAALEHGRPADDENVSAIFLEDSETALNPDLSLEDAGIEHRQHVHIHRNKKIDVTVTFNGLQKSHNFPPSKTVGKVKKWAAKEFSMAEEDAIEHILQVSGSKDRPDEHSHIGALIEFPAHQLFFDLVPKVRVEG